MNRFVRILAISASAVAMASSAYAADLIISEPMSQGFVEAPASGNWDGVYIGVFGGYGAGTGEIEGAPDDWALSGWLAGATLGANFTLTEGIVAGVVGDIAWTNLSDDTLGVEFTQDWAGSVRGRLGFDGGVFMPYVTGGLAVAGVTLDTGASDSQTHLGWTAGAGVEFAATEDLSVDLLYRYSDYGTQEYFGGVDASLTTHQATIGVNWKF